MSRTFSTRSGSSERWKFFSTRWGLSPNARQSRPIVAELRPTCLAIFLVLQCVIPFGLVSRVLTTMSSMRSSLILRGAPGRGLSKSPSTRSSMKRRRHFPTVALPVCNATATSVSLKPSALLSTMLARRARCRFVRARRTYRSSAARSSSASAIDALGLPVLAIPTLDHQSITFDSHF